MAVTLVPKLRSRERILVYGGSGVGKSSCLLSVAERCPNSTFRVLDNDDSYDRLVEAWPDEHNGKRIENVVSRVGYDWESSIKYLDELEEDGTENDWLVIDMASQLWDWVQEYFVDKLYGTDIGDYFLSKRQQLEARRQQEGKSSGGGLGTFEQNTDWATIKKVMDSAIHRRLLRWPGHVFLMSEEAKLGGDADKDTKQSFGHIGLKPRGHSRTPHIAQSVFHLRRVRPSTVEITTAKDRGRAVFEDVEFTDFVGDYLIPVAGWKIAKI